MVAPRLLVSPNIVDHGDRTPGEAPTDGYTQRDIWRKGAGRGLAADAAPGNDRGDALAPWSRCMGAGAPGSPARYTRGLSQVHARSIALRNRSRAGRGRGFCGPLSGPAGGARSALGTQPRPGKSAMSSGERCDRPSAAVVGSRRAWHTRVPGAGISPGSQAVTLRPASPGSGIFLALPRWHARVIWSRSSRASR